MEIPGKQPNNQFQINSSKFWMEPSPRAPWLQLRRLQYNEVKKIFCWIRCALISISIRAMITKIFHQPVDVRGFR